MTARALPPLNALRAFHAAGSHGEIQAAAGALGVTPSAVSHQVRALEAWLGTPLFHRSVRRITLTAAGRLLLAQTELALDRIAVAVETVRTEAEAPLVRVSGLPLFTPVWLIPRLGRLRERHPEIEISVETTNRLVDLEHDGVDVAIRNSREPPRAGAVRKLFDISATPVCAPALMSGPDLISAPADLARHTLIHVSSRGDSWDHWLRQAGVPGLKPKAVLGFDGVPEALEAAAAGHGVALAIEPLIWAAPVAARLLAPIKMRTPREASYYVVRRRGVVRPAVSAFVEWLSGEAALDRRGAPAPSRQDVT